LSKKTELIPASALDADIVNDQPIEREEEELIAQLSIGDLFKIGVSYNHLKSAGIIIGAIVWFFSELEDIMPDLMNEDNALMAVIGTGSILALFVLLAFTVISFLFSMIRSFFRYYDLNFKRRGNGFKIISGLITRQEFSALDNKIQQVGWKDNLLQKKLFGIFDFTLKQAGSVAINSKKSINIPGVDFTQIKSIIRYHFGELDLSQFEFNAVSKKMLYRWWLYLTIVFLPIIIMAFTVEWFVGVFVILWYLFFGYSQWKSYHKTKYAISQNVLCIRGGTYGDENVLIKLHKIQSLEINQSPYQKRHELASLIINTASGKNKIPYIPLARAKKMSNLLLYKVQSSNKSWM